MSPEPHAFRAPDGGPSLGQGIGIMAGNFSRETATRAWARTEPHHNDISRDLRVTRVAARTGIGTRHRNHETLN
jgi:hypothetical protein